MNLCIFPYLKLLGPHKPRISRNALGLASSQGRHISQRVPLCSVQQYLEKFKKSDRKRMSLLGHKGGHLRRDSEAESSIMTIWQISFDYIRQSRISAADLLSLMSFFDRQGIPEALLRGSETKQSREKLEDADMNGSFGRRAQALAFPFKFQIIQHRPLHPTIVS